jgi:hypothetical protein
MSYPISFTSDSSLANGLHVSAALGGGAPHAFLVDTGSVGVLVPRQVLGPDYQDFDPARDITFGYVSSGASYQGQWVKVSVVLGVPADWDGAGDYPIAEVEVFAVDQPAGFDGGVLGIGFGISGQADGGPARNPLLHVRYRGKRHSRGYVLSAQGLTVGLTEVDTQDFGLIALEADASGDDWLQPLGSYSLSGAVSAAARERHLLGHGQQRLGNRERGAGDVAADKADLEAAVLHQQTAERVGDCRHMQEFASPDELPQAFGLHTSSPLLAGQQPPDRLKLELPRGTNSISKAHSMSCVWIAL